MATNAAQHHPAEVEVVAFAYLNVIRPLLLDGTRDLNSILNMDQTPVYHAMNYKSTIHQKGGHTIDMRTSAADTKCITVVVTVTASGKSLRPMVVFKGIFQK